MFYQTKKKGEKHFINIHNNSSKLPNFFDNYKTIRVRGILIHLTTTNIQVTSREPYISKYEQQRLYMKRPSSRLCKFNKTILQRQEWIKTFTYHKIRESLPWIHSLKVHLKGMLHEECDSATQQVYKEPGTIPDAGDTSVNNARSL